MTEVERVAEAIHAVHCGCGDFTAHQDESRQQFASQDTVYLASARAAITALQRARNTFRVDLTGSGSL